MRVKKYALLLGLWLLTGGLNAQVAYQVAGIVRDAVTGLRLDSLTVSGHALYDPTVADSGFFPGESWWLIFNTTGTADQLALPLRFSLEQNYPNPYNPSTHLRFSVPQAGRYTFKSYNLLGQELARRSFDLTPGIYTLTYTSRTAGLNFIELKGAGYRKVIKTLNLEPSGYTGFRRLKLAGGSKGALSRSAQGLVVVIRAWRAGYHVDYDTLELQAGILNSHNPSLWPSIPPTITLTPIVTAVEVGDFQTPLPLATYSISDPDPGDVVTLTVSANTDSAFLRVTDSLVLLDSLIDGYLGVIEYTLTARDSAGAVGYAHGSLEILSNYPPTVELNPLVTELNVRFFTPPVILATYNVYDRDSSDTYTVDLSLNTDSVYLSLSDSLIMLDSLVRGYLGEVRYNLTAIDNRGGVGQVAGSLNVYLDTARVHFVFKAMYADTVLTSGVSTLTYRRMFNDTSDYMWSEDSVITSTTGVITLNLVPGVYDIGAQHTESLIYGPTQYTFLTRPNMIGVLEERAYQDDQSPVLFNFVEDTIIVYKLMSDFPMFWMIEYASKLDGLNIGTRRFGNNDLNALAWWNLNHMAPDSLRRAWTQELIAELQTIPHVHLAMQYVESSEDPAPGQPRLEIGVDPSFPSPGTNITSFDENNNIIYAQAKYPPWPSEYTFKIEILQAIGDLEDFGGGNPAILGWDENHVHVYINDLGRRIFSLLYLANPKTKF